MLSLTAIGADLMVGEPECVMRNEVSGAMAHPAGRVFCLTLLRCVSEFNLCKVPILPFTTRPLWCVAQIYTWGEKKTLTLLHCAIFFMYYKN